MRSWLFGIVLGALVLTLSGTLLAAGGDASIQDADEDSAEASDDAAAGLAEASNGPVLACDGDLCDTLQGRPSCALTAPGVAGDAGHGAWLCGLAFVGVGLVRRRKGGRGDRSWFVA